MGLALSIILWIFVILIVSALPLYVAVKVLGGKTTILKTLFVMLLTAVVSVIVTPFFAFGGVIAFILLIWIYHEMFRLKWIKAFIAWVLQVVFIYVLVLILGILGFGFLTGLVFF